MKTESDYSYNPPVIERRDHKYHTVNFTQKTEHVNTNHSFNNIIINNIMQDPRYRRPSPYRGSTGSAETLVPQTMVYIIE